jgi:carbonic anhydrase
MFIVPAFPQSEFSDIISANETFVKGFKHSELTGTARKGLAIITCMDSRISPLAVVGMQAGDAKILRNAGARVTDDVLRTLVLASYLLGVNRVLVMPHTDCRMASENETSIHATIEEQFGVDTRSIEFQTVSDQRVALEIDVNRIRQYPLLQRGVSVVGAIYNVSTGKLEPVDC